MTTLIIENSNTLRNIMKKKLKNVFIINMEDRSEIHNVLKDFKCIDLIIVDISDYSSKTNCLTLLQSHIQNNDARIIIPKSKESSECLVDKFKSEKDNIFLDLYMNCSVPLFG